MFLKITGCSLPEKHDRNTMLCIFKMESKRSLKETVLCLIPARSIACIVYNNGKIEGVNKNGRKQDN